MALLSFKIFLKIPMDEISTLSISISLASLGIYFLFFYSNDDDDQDGGKLIKTTQNVNYSSWIEYLIRTYK